MPALTYARPLGAGLKPAPATSRADLVARRKALGFGLAAVGAALGVGQNARAASYDPAHDPAVAEVRAYLDGLTTLKARFLQANADGSVSDGIVYLARPDKLRFEYQTPKGLLLVANGTSLRVYDPEIDKVTELPFSDTPASLMLREEIDLGGDINVIAVGREGGVVTITVNQRASPGAGALTAVFSEHPFELKQWTVHDAQGYDTRITLFDTQADLPLDPTLFDLARLPLTPAGENR
jgi:outer membrane lipoprotein-sorting protein